MKFPDRNWWILAGLFLLTIPLVMPHVRGDGNGYYAYIRSMVIDHDLRFDNEFRRGDTAFQRVVFDDNGEVRETMHGSEDHVRNQWAVGASLLWAPFFLAAHLVVQMINSVGVHVEPDGFSFPYLWICGVGTACYSFAGLLMSYSMAKRFARPGLALGATCAVWFATPLPVYMYFLPFHVHALSAFSVAAYFWYGMKTQPDRTGWQWCVWGLLAGLMTEVYYLNFLIVLVSVTDWFWQFAGAGDRVARWHHGFQCAAAFCVAAIAALIPHFVIKAIVNGSPFRTGYDDQFFWTSPRVWQVAFSPEHGMFLWTPLLILAALGLGLLFRRDRRLAMGVAASFVAFYYAVSSYQNWHGQSSFGSRFFVSFTPAFIVGLAVLLEDLHRVFESWATDRSTSHAGRQFKIAPRFISISVLCALVIWNIGFIFQWGTNLIPNRGPVDLQAVASNQFTVVPQRLGGFLSRYLVAREQVTSEIEDDDLIEMTGYQAVR